MKEKYGDKVMIDLLKKNGPFFKANLHCHTTLSDGHMTAQQVKD